MDGREFKSGHGKQIAELTFGAFPASCYREHIKIEKLGERGFICGRYHEIYYQEPALRLMACRIFRRIAAAGASSQS